MYQDTPITQESRLWAYASYASVFVGLPIFLVPLAQRNDSFALFHAKHAAMVFLLWVVLLGIYVVFTMVTCGVGALLPFFMLAYVPAIHGFLIVTRDEWKEPVGLLGAADRFLASVQVEEKK